jgi:hypothetical protein
LQVDAGRIIIFGVKNAEYVDWDAHVNDAKHQQK